MRFFLRFILCVIVVAVIVVATIFIYRGCESSSDNDETVYEQGSVSAEMTELWGLCRD